LAPAVTATKLPMALPWSSTTCTAAGRAVVVPSPSWP